MIFATNLDIISVNIWQILISLLNLVLLFLLLKKFLYKPVRDVLQKRQDAINGKYSDAQMAKDEADAIKAQWDEKISGADDEAEEIIKTARENAERLGGEIVEQSKAKAESIVRKAEQDAEIEKKKAQSEIKEELVGVSVALSEKLLRREINEDDHRKLIDSFIEELD